MRPFRTPQLLGVLALAFAIGRPSVARAFSPFLAIPDPEVAEATPAYRYANMTDAEAIAELDRRKILYTKLDAAPGVRAPVRLTGRLHGVYIHSSLPPEERVKSLFEILDARLLLALDDFAAVLERHDIDEVMHFTMYRPNVARRITAFTTSKSPARRRGGRARRTASRAPPRSRLCLEKRCLGSRSRRRLPRARRRPASEPRARWTWARAGRSRAQA